jgi:hypothetical protein
VKGIRQYTPACALGRLTPNRQDAEAIKRDGWRNRKILVVSLEDPRLDFVMRAMVKQIGEALYGRG